jgi:hypothetical protein
MVNNENRRIQKININVETNIEDEKPFELKYKTINNPVQSGEYTSNTEDFDYPYFTPDIAYSPEVLLRYLTIDYGKVVRTFFDVNLFSEMVNESNDESKKKNPKIVDNNNVNNANDDSTNDDDKNVDNNIVDNNIYLTLLFLFPMRYPQSANVNSSYDKYIKKQLINPYKNYFPSSDSLSSVFLGQIYDIEKEAIREYSYINSSQGIATVTEITWLNDVLNNKKYRGLIDKLIQYDNWYTEKKETIGEEIQNAQIDLITSMQTEKFNFTTQDVKEIESQKNISYRKIDLTNDIIDVIKKYIVFVYDNKDEQRNECMKKLYDKLFLINDTNGIKNAVDDEQNKIDVNRLWDKIEKELFDLNINTKAAPNFLNKRAISSPHNVIFDFLKYKTINDTISKKNIENVKIYSYIKLNYKNKNEKMEEIDFSAINAEVATHIKNKKTENVSVNNCNIIKDTLEIYEELKKRDEFKEMIKDIKSDISKLLERYNSNYSNIANVNQFSANDLIAIDINVDKAVKEMKKIIENLEDIKKKKIGLTDDKEHLNTTFKKIMNSVDSLKNFFSESSIIKNRITGISSIQIKLERILKKSNEIKALQLVQQYLFSDIAKGIYLYYDDEKKTESSDILKKELKKDKYSFFTNTVKYIKDNFLNVESTNKQLTRLMRYYFENTGDELIETVVGPAKKIINENKVEKNPLLNTGVTRITSNKENMPVYEIDIYMELIIGKLDYQKQKKIKCEYRDEKLLAYFDKFASNPNNYEIIKKKAITLKDGKENAKNANKANNEKKMKGGKPTRKKKYLQYLQYNKRYTSKRR